MKRFIDIGANLTDSMYLGIYHGSKKHDADLQEVLSRSWTAGLQKIIITGGNLDDAKKCLDLAKKDERLYITVGCHPTRCTDFLNNNANQYLNALKTLILENPKKVVAIGEIGLDYDRLAFCDKETQKKYFELQLELCETIKLPLFLHCRAAFCDFSIILKKHIEKIGGGVVHSFDGTNGEMKQILDMGFYIGLNGCSLKTPENLEVVKHIPTKSIMIETDAPWCEIKQSHAGFNYVKTKYASVKKEKWQSGSMVKGRTEPSHIIQVLEVIAAVKNEDLNEMSTVIYDNTMKLFFPSS